MLPNNLTTNEVKDAAGAEVEMLRMATSDRKLIFAKNGETPALPHRLTISHQEVGSGLKMRRRSVVRIDKTSMSTVDATVPVTTSAYCVLDAPIGAVIADTELKAVLANLNSFLSTTGAATTVLFDGTGSGTAALCSGSL